MEKKHDLLFCPECGVKLDGDEFVCPNCGYRLADLHSTQKPEEPVVPPAPPLDETTTFTPPPPSAPVEETPKIAPEDPAVEQKTAYTTPPPMPSAAKKKGLGTGLWILIILLIVLIFGGGTAAFLQYNGTADIPVVRNFIPTKSNPSGTITNGDDTRYYVVHSFGFINTKYVAIISNVVCSKVPGNSDEGAKTKFIGAIMNKYKKDYTAFLKGIIPNHYSSKQEADKAHNECWKKFKSDSRNYEIWNVDFTY